MKVSHAEMQSRFEEVENGFQIRTGGSDDSQAEGVAVVRKEALTGSESCQKMYLDSSRKRVHKKVLDVCEQ